MKNTDTEKQKNTMAENRVRIIVRREFVGDKNMAEVMVPILYDDIRKKLEDSGTFDIPPACA